MAPARKVVLCADDYGLTEGVSRGILELAEAGRISATSAIATMPDWPRLGPALRPFRGRIGIGLHLNFTAAAPLGALPRLAPEGRLPALAGLLRAALTGGLDPREIRAEIDRQLDTFTEAYGGPPDFLDGHQHVHVLPVIRPALLEALRKRGLRGRLWLRDPSDGVRPILRREVSARKALIVKSLALGFRRAARAGGFDTNEGFSGFSPFQAETPPERVFGQALRELGPRPLVMAHPGYADESLRALDPEVDSRPKEFAYLKSDAFGRLLEERGLVPTSRP